MEIIPQWAARIWMRCQGHLAAKGIKHGGEAIRFDVDQKRVVELGNGYHLVLAPPGCGKTEILAQRLLHALDAGVDPGRMLSLTFTNRASRGMRDRVWEKAGTRARDVFIGNLHAFCSCFLYQQRLIPQLSEIIDEDDQADLADRILPKEKIEQMLVSHVDMDAEGARYFINWPVLKHFFLRGAYQPTRSGFVRELRKNAMVADCLARLVQLAHWQDQVERGHELEVRLHPEFADWEDSSFLAPYAKKYVQVCRTHGYVDFDDLLILAYDGLSKGAAPARGTYTWMQIDEVQDLNPLQLAIAQELLAPEPSVVYFGDEQQAIFSFMGAKLETLAKLRAQCGGEVLRLRCNYRSPRYMIEMLNDYATRNLGVDRSLLPNAAQGTSARREAGGMAIQRFDFGNEAEALVSRTLPRYLAGATTEAPTPERTAILVPTNALADEISSQLKASGRPHFKISGTDIFRRPSVKAVLAHLAVARQEHCIVPWARLLAATGVLPSAACAREFAGRSLQSGVLPGDWMRTDGRSLLADFCQTVREKTLVVFDTETTGLDVDHDDIVQIAAVKMRGGVVLPGSEFDVCLETDREIPAMLGDLPNPLIREYARRVKLGRAEGLRQFVDYARGGVLLAHNASFDMAILRQNLEHAAVAGEGVADAECLDSMKIARALFRRLRSYRLKDLLEQLGLEGRNTHLANDDVDATAALVACCWLQAQRLEAEHRAFLQTHAGPIAQFREAYGPSYQGIRARLAGGGDALPPGAYATALVAEMDAFRKGCKALRLQEGDEEALDRVLLFFDQDVVDARTFPSLRAQLGEYAPKFGTYKGADLCESSSMEERIFVSTVHKAKGLEFENVIVASADSNTYPRYNATLEQAKEAARVLYVALSRARKRLCLTFGATTRWGRSNDVSCFMTSVKHHFTWLDDAGRPAT